ncbi:MAG TPA: TetR/AcrR family transcriptional regulator [Gemmatales bacterium]|nr:TetR/AcrR family transcriptional regulator [Gemmatales bacterium]
MAEKKPSRQIRKTKVAVIEAFNDLVLQGRYHDMGVGDIVRHSDIGRSTFYEHFKDKEDVLRHSMAGMLSAMAGAVDESCDIDHVQRILEHFHENISMARVIFNSPTMPVIINALASLIEVRLPSEAISDLPTSLIATQIAEAQFGLIRGWLNKGGHVSGRIVAEALHRSSSKLSSEYQK